MKTVAVDGDLMLVIVVDVVVIVRASVNVSIPSRRLSSLIVYVT